jgi:hypothetical protein
MAEYIDDENCLILSGKKDGVTVSAKVSQKSSRSSAGSSFLLAAMIAALTPPIEVPAITLHFIPSFSSARYTPHSYAPKDPPPCNTRTVSSHSF